MEKELEAGDKVKLICNGIDCGQVTIKKVDNEIVWIEYDTGVIVKLTNNGFEFEIVS